MGSEIHSGIRNSVGGFFYDPVWITPQRKSSASACSVCRFSIVYKGFEISSQCLIIDIAGFIELEGYIFNVLDREDSCF